LTGALIVAADVRGGDDSTIASEAEALEGMLAASGLKRGVALDSLVGPQATKTAIRDHIATRRYNVLHFCGHSEYDAASPGGSYLEVHDEHDPRKARKLMADDIKAWYQDYGLQVVLLNSCSAAASPESGSMIGGIAHAFVGLGIPYVIGPRCEITQDAAQKLALAFYESLIDGSDPVGAVSAARQAVYEGFDSVDPAWGSVIAYSP
jgi:CHAT domain-containing protein